MLIVDIFQNELHIKLGTQAMLPRSLWESCCIR